MSMRFEVIQAAQFSDVLAVVKTALFDYIDKVFGWDDGFQQTRLINDYEPHWYRWVYEGKRRIGLVCFKYKEGALHLHLMIIFPEYQGKGLGSQVMDYLRHAAIENACHEISLWSFMLNQGALRFYQGLGYQVVNEEEHFYMMALRL